ncbi:hypothetical protein [Flavisolibacter nicotianae]|uniref:hypothetical protein n=1 Tax=Flavisolibacter nicotianae TaxID=2364882 RepID=UPI000EACEBE3|nr:hypothetical protein [Flavisolibacter nicotianae]
MQQDSQRSKLDQSGQQDQQQDVSNQRQQDQRQQDQNSQDGSDWNNYQSRELSDKKQDRDRSGI